MTLFNNLKKAIYFNLLLVLALITINTNNKASGQDAFGILPGPDGGEIKVLAINSLDAIIAGTWGNGIMRSISAGATWTNINIGLTNMYITDIKIGPQNVFYASTWGGGVFKSVDNGNTWTEQNSGISNLKVKCLFIKNKDTIFAGTYGNGIYRSVNAGATWQAINAGLTYQDVNCIGITRAGTLLIGTYGGGLFLSTNNGDNWKYNNGGIGSKYINTFYLRLKDSVTVAATNGDGLYSTDNDAKSWGEFQDASASNLTDQNITCLTTILSKGIHEFVVGTRAKGVQYYTSVSYDQYRPSSIIGGGVNAIVKSSNGDLYAATPRKGLYKSTDNGVIWTYVSWNFNQTLHVYKLFKPKGNLMFASAKDGGLFRSIDRGENWSLSGFAGLKIQDLIITNANRVLVEINQAAADPMWSSLDSGKTWSKNSGAADTVLSIVELSNNDILAFYFRQPAVSPPTQPDPRVRVKRSVDGGITFTEVLPSPNIKGNIAKFIQRPNGNIFGYTSLIGVPSLYKSLNNGASYTNLSSFTATVTAQDIKSSPDNSLYFATDQGLFKSVNDGLTWPLNNLGFVYPNTSTLPDISSFAIKSNSELYAAIQNSDGFYKTNDAGLNWDSLNSSFSVADVQAVTLNADNDVYISTSSLYRMVNPSSMGVPSLNSPLDMKAGVDLNPSFTWTASTKADMFELELSQSENFDYANLFFTQTPTELTVYDSLQFNTKYYWRVRGKNNGSYSDWSISRQFATKLAPPQLASPINNKRGVRVLPQLSVRPVESSSSYTVQVSNSNSFTTIAFNGAANDTTIIDSTIELKALTEYWWRAKASSSITSSDWSYSWKFRTTVDRPKLKEPFNNSIYENTDFIAKWDTVNEATSYEYQIALDTIFVNIINFGQTKDLDNTPFTNLEFNIKYYWRVRGRNSEGTGEWSQAWNFKTSVQAPKLVAPDSGLVNMPLSAIFRWGSVKNAVKYHLQVSEKSDFSSIFYESSTITALEQQVKGFNKYTIYYWRVSAKDNLYESPFSKAWTIKTLMDTTRLKEPLNKAIDVAINPYLMWLPTKGAISYKLQISRNDSYTDLRFDDSTLTITQKDFNFGNDSTFWWRVKAKSIDGANEWSERWSFKTVKIVGGSVEDDIALSTFNVYPNPFDESLTINFSLIKDAKVQIKVIDLAGSEIAILKDSYLLNGEQKIEWKPFAIAKGTYFLQVKIGDSSSLREIKFGK